MELANIVKESTARTVLKRLRLLPCKDLGLEGKLDSMTQSGMDEMIRIWGCGITTVDAFKYIPRHVVIQLCNYTLLFRSVEGRKLDLPPIELAEFEKIGDRKVLITFPEQLRKILTVMPADKVLDENDESF